MHSIHAQTVLLLHIFALHNYAAQIIFLRLCKNASTMLPCFLFKRQKDAIISLLSGRCNSTVWPNSALLRDTGFGQFNPAPQPSAYTVQEYEKKINSNNKDMIMIY